MLILVDFLAVNLDSALCWLTLRHLETLLGNFPLGQLDPAVREVQGERPPPTPGWAGQTLQGSAQSLGQQGA